MKNCPFCAERIQDEAIKCKHCGSSLVAEKSSAQNQQPSQIVVKKRSGCMTLLVVIFCIGILAAIVLNSLNDARKKVSDSQKTETNQPATPKIPYTVIQTWTIPNGGKGERIVIDPKYVDFDDMTALGEMLKEDLQNDRNDFISVFTDKKSALLQANVANLNNTDGAYLGKHFVGDYTKNANTGLNQFLIYLNGVDDLSAATNKVINY